MKNEIIKTLTYFSLFQYPPAFDEIYTFVEKKTSIRTLKKYINTLVRNKKIVTQDGYFCSSTDKSIITQYQKRKSYSHKKIKKISFFTKVLALFPQIKLIGLSGSVAMMNAKQNDDIDLFIITARNRLFTGRFVALVMAQMLGLRRVRHSGNTIKDKICLNLFFDESNMVVPKLKKTPYVGHEILQMKPIINKDNIYERFLVKNGWVLDIFPNAIKIFNFPFFHQGKQFSIFNQFEISNLIFNKNFKLIINNLGDYIEKILKKFQLEVINKHKTTEIITDSQLWFFPDDFEKKLIRRQPPRPRRYA